MANCPYDLRDYLFDELTPAQRLEVEGYLETSSEAREELERLRLTRRSLLSVGDEEMPRRIAFVSDKVFEPSPMIRLWRDFWAVGPRLAFGLATVLAVLFGGLWLVQPTVTADQAGWRIAFGPPAEARPTPQPTASEALTEEQVKSMILAVVAEHQQQQREALTRMISAQSGQTEASVNRLRREFRGLRQDSEAAWQLMRDRVEGLYPMAADTGLASRGR